MVVDKERTIFINEKLDIGMSGRICAQIMELSYMGKTPIYLMINSLGGHIRALTTLMSAIKASRCEIITYNIGIAASSAAILFLQGNRRYMLEGSELLFHEPIKSQAQGISYSELKDFTVILEEEYTLFIEEMYKKSILTKEQIQKNIYKKEWILGASESLENGFATDIVTKF